MENVIEIGGIITEVVQRDPLIFKVKSINHDTPLNIHCQFPCYVFAHDCIYAICQQTTPSFDNHYKVLEIDIDATQEKISKAYKKKAIIYHPDKNDGKDEKFKECLNAYEILTDVKKKKEYDQELKEKSKEAFYHVVKHPFILIAKDKNSMIISFVRILKIDYKSAGLLFHQICNYINDEDKVYDHITDLAERWHHVHDYSILDMFGTNDYAMDKLLDEWYEDYNIRSLQLLGLTRKEIMQMDLPCDILYNKCINNPYTVYALPMSKADEIMERMNKEPNTEDKQRGVIVRSLWENTEKRKYMCTSSRKLCTSFQIKPHIEALKQDYQVVAETVGTCGMVYLEKYHKIENYICNYIINSVKTLLDKTYNITYTRDDLSQDQINAIKGSLSHTFSIIRGFPGSGKSTIIAELVNILDKHDTRYALTSFTGKAVCKIREVTKKDTAKTMHRFISEAKKLSKNSDANKFTVAIVDEISMVTLELMYQFLLYHPTIEQIICIGDVNQLQPIDVGCLLGQILKAQVVPTYALTTIHRVVKNVQNEGIILNCNLIINHNCEYPFEFMETDNFKVIDGDINVCMELVKIYYGAGIRNIVVISPYNSWVRELNKRCQSIYFPDAVYVTDNLRKEITKWFVGDKVMLTKNIHSINIFNGQCGKVIGIDENNINVVFDQSDKVHTFTLNPKNKRVYDEDDDDDHDCELSVLKLQHCYAMTITKSQGSECDFVFGFFPEGEKANNTCFLNKTTIYTLISRSKRMCTVIGNKQLLSDMVCRSPAWRCEGLAMRLTKALPIYKVTQQEEDDDYYEYTNADYEEYY